MTTPPDLKDRGGVVSPVRDARQSTTAAPKRPTKIAMIARELLRRSLNRFEAEEIGDHVLPSTVSQLKARGYPVQSRPETIPTRFGSKVRTTRYYVAPEDGERAQRVLAGLS